MPPKPLILTESAAHLVDSLGDIGPVECKRFFGGISLRRGGRQFGMILNDCLYFAVSGVLHAEMTAAGGEPFRYQKAQRTVTVQKYLRVPSPWLDDAETLNLWARRVISAA